MNKKIISIIICCLFIASASLNLVSATPQLTLTSQADASLYDRYAQATYIGSMAYNNYVSITYPSDGLVGLEIKDPSHNTMIARTIRTGDSTPYDLSANIDAAYLCSSGGTQLSSIPLPTTANEVTPYYYIHVQNNMGSIQNMLLTFNVFDSNGVPISLAYSNLQIDAYSESYVRSNFLIPYWAHYGIAYAYVSAFSNWPSQGGVPLSMERTFQFTITGGTPFIGTAPTTYSLNGINHYYNFTYRLPKNCGIGTFTTYSTANYLGIQSLQTSTYQVAQIGDLNADGAVNFRDLSAFVSFYVGYYNNHVFVQAIDFNGDGKINFNDITSFVKYYVFYWSP